MTRIFGTLTLLVVVSSILCAVHGFLAGDYNALWRASSPANPDAPGATIAQPPHRDSFEDVQQRTRTHILAGLFISLLGVLVNSLSITYFIGTGRWSKEVVQAYALDAAWLRESQSLKRSCFPWAMMGIVAVLAMVVTGAACDPSTLMANTAQWVLLHAAATVAGTVLIALAMWKQFRYLQRNQQLIQKITQCVREIRDGRGLPID
jgi:hypothetical protein